MRLHRCKEQTVTKRRHTAIFSSLLLAGTLLSGCSDTHSQPDNQPAYPFSGNETVLKEASKEVPFTRQETMFMIRENQMLIWFDDAASRDDIVNVNSYLSENNVLKVGQIPAVRMLQYEVPANVDMNVYLDAVEKMPGVSVALPNAIVSPAKDPDPNTPRDVFSGFWWIDSIRATQAWDTTIGSDSIPIAVLDSGLNKNSASFMGKTIHFGGKCLNADSTHFFSTEEECTQHTDPQTGQGSRWFYTPAEHGEMVTGVLSSRGDDGIGGVGVAWNNPIISIDINAEKPGACMPGTPYSDINAAMLLAMNLGAKVINISQGPDLCEQSDENTCVCTRKISPAQDHFTSFRASLIETMKEAVKKNVLVVFAAGNSGFKADDLWLSPEHPSSDKDAFISNSIIVGAIDEWEDPMCSYDYASSSALELLLGPLCYLDRLIKRCDCSACSENNIPFTHEGQVVELSAPGFRIAAPDATKTDGSLILVSGTSVSSPMVAGAAGLIFGMHPDFSVAKVKQAMLDSARQTSGTCHSIGKGILDVAAAIGQASSLQSSDPAVTCYKIAGVGSTSAPAISGNNIVFRDGSSLYYADIYDMNIHQVPGTDACKPSSLEPASISGDTIVFYCTGTTCSGYNICSYRINEDSISVIDHGFYPQLHDNILTYLGENAEGATVLRYKNLTTEESREKVLPAPLTTNWISSNGAKVVFSYPHDVSGNAVYDFYLYDFDSGELRIIQADSPSWSSCLSVYGDAIVFSLDEGINENARIFRYDMQSGSSSIINSDFSSVQNCSKWETFSVFYGVLESTPGLYMVDVSSGDSKRILESSVSLSPSLNQNNIAYWSAPGDLLSIWACRIGDLQP